MVFKELKDTLFDIVKGNHAWTRQSKVRAYHPYIATPPSHTDTNGIVIEATFGGRGGEHIMVLRGNNSDTHFREMALSLIVNRCSSHRGPMTTSGVTDRRSSFTRAAERRLRQNSVYPLCRSCQVTLERSGGQRSHYMYCQEHSQEGPRPKAPRQRSTQHRASKKTVTEAPPAPKSPTGDKPQEGQQEREQEGKQLRRGGRR